MKPRVVSCKQKCSLARKNRNVNYSNNFKWVLMFLRQHFWTRKEREREEKRTEQRGRVADGQSGMTSAHLLNLVGATVNFKTRTEISTTLTESFIFVDKKYVFKEILVLPFSLNYANMYLYSPWTANEAFRKIADWKAYKFSASFKMKCFSAYKM